MFKESQFVELKESLNANFKKEIVAFANTNGGEIYIGVSDDGTVVGVDNPEQVMESVSNMIHDGIHPDMIPFSSIEEINRDNKIIIKVTVSRGARQPYYITDKGLKPSGVFIRHGISSVPASEEIIRNMLKSENLPFEKGRSLNQNLSFEYASHYFKSRNTSFTKENMRSLGLIDKDGFYSNIALLLSDNCEHSIKCAVFQNNDKLHFKARKEFSGSIFKQLEDAFDFITLNNNQTTTFDGLRRIDTNDYPYFAIREALINAIIHRDYSFSGSIIISIFSNRIEIVSIGGLVESITLDDIMHGISQPRNTALANIFYRLELIECYGSGIRRIIESYPNDITPKFEDGPNSFVATLPNVNYSKSNNRTISNSYYTVEESNVPFNNMAKLTPEEKIMELLKHKKEVSKKEIEKLLNCSEFTARQFLNSLISSRKIQVIGKARATRYKKS